MKKGPGGARAFGTPGMRGAYCTITTCVPTLTRL